MHNSGIFRGLVISHPPTLEQAKQQNRRAALLFIFLLVVFGLLMLFFSIQCLWQAWQAGRWGDSFWMESFISQVLIPFFPASVAFFGFSTTLAQAAINRVVGVEAMPLREAAAAGDERFAPLAEQQPARLSAASAAADVDQGEHFRVRAAGEKGKYIQIVVDEQGIEWKNPQWWRLAWRRLSWGEARAFYTFFYLSSSGRYTSERQQVYVLDAPTHTLVWRAAFPWIKNTAQEKAAIERLHGLIANYTGLPLRDLTKTTDDLEIVLSNTFAEFPTAEQRAKAAQRFASWPQTRQHIKPLKRQLIAYSGLAPFLLLVLFTVTTLG